MFPQRHGVERSRPAHWRSTSTTSRLRPYHLLPPLQVYKSRSRSFPVGMCSPAGVARPGAVFATTIFSDHLGSHSPRGSGRSGTSGEALRDPQLDILDDNFTLDNHGEADSRGHSSPRLKLDINLQNGIRVDGPMTRCSAHETGRGLQVAFGVEKRDPHVQGRAHKVVDLERARKLTATPFARHCHPWVFHHRPAGTRRRRWNGRCGTRSR